MVRKSKRIRLHLTFLDERGPGGGRESITKPKPFEISQNSFFQAFLSRVPGTPSLAVLGRPILSTITDEKLPYPDSHWFQGMETRTNRSS